MYWVGHRDVYNPTYTEITEADGTYKHVFDNLNLHDGMYKIIVRPANQQYFGLNVTKDLIVIPHPLTTDQLITYLFALIGAAVAIISGVIKIPGYITQRKQASKLRDCIRTVNLQYHEYKETKNPSQIDKDKYRSLLETLRDNFLDLVPDRKITEDQYKMLDDLVSNHLNKIT
jgi:hypothetical protein